ncbi:MAG: N-acetyltransferase [Tissierellia bacterium]|nr:N-acetyltransferase [Tissierellia bacterium]
MEYEIIYFPKEKWKVVDESYIQDIITFGPLCVEPEWQGCGVGELLLRETMNLAASKGYKGIVIFGEPDYYPRLGFKTCDNFNITTSDGKNFDAFMGIELAEDSMKGIKGKFYESEVFNNLPKDEVEEYNKKFPQLKKLRFPGQ